MLLNPKMTELYNRFKLVKKPIPVIRTHSIFDFGLWSVYKNHFKIFVLPQFNIEIKSSICHLRKGNVKNI